MQRALRRLMFRKLAISHALAILSLLAAVAAGFLWGRA
jgi:hypothetical protein